MRMSLPAANPCLAIALVLALAACRQEAPPEAPAPVDAPSATASDQAIAAPGPAASTGDEALEGEGESVLLRIRDIDLAVPRRYEVAATLNRMRELRVRQSGE